MPSLVLLGLRTAVSGDDLRVFSVFAILLRIIQLVLIAPLLGLMIRVGRHTHDRVCARERRELTDSGMAIMYSFLIISGVVAILQIVNDAWIFRVSSVGTPVESSKRQKLQWLCAVKFGPNSLLRVAALVLGIISSDLVHDYCYCLPSGHEGSAPENICPNYYAYVCFLRGLLVTLCIEVAASVLIYVYFLLNWIRPRHWICRGLTTLRSQQSQSGDGSGSAASKPAASSGGWSLVCRICCTCTSLLTCCLFGGQEAVMSDFVDISVALEELFDDAGHLDVTVSDILNGLVLLAREQFEHRRELKGKLLEHHQLSPDEEGARPVEGDRAHSPAKRKVVPYIRMSRHGDDHQTFFEETKREMLNMDAEEDRNVIVEGAHFMRLSLAIYGHGMYLFNHSFGGLAKLAYGWLCGKDRATMGVVHGDNLCGCNANAFLHESNVDPQHILYANYSSGVAKRPYCVVIDHEFRGVVVIVRGTFALEDAVTDISLRPVSLRDAGVQYGFDGESEYAHSGMFASAEWVAEDLKRLGILDSLLRGTKCRYPDYRLYIAGHSLGAGVAAILALMLHSAFPTLRCLCFEPPGCVLSERAAKQDYIVSFVHGADIVPRLSVSALESFRDDVLEMIARSQVPKYKVLAPNPLDRDVPEKLAHRRTSIPESSFHQQLKEFWSYHRELKSERGERCIPLLVPGKRIVHLVKVRDKSQSTTFLMSSSAPFPALATTAIWAESEDFLEIQLASSLLSDHDPGVLTRLLETLVASTSPSK